MMLDIELLKKTAENSIKEIIPNKEYKISGEQSIMIYNIILSLIKELKKKK